jgi:hypothetical protein
MANARRCILRPAPIPTSDQRQRRLQKLRTSLDSERHALNRWQKRLKRAFTAVDKCNRRIIRIERQIALWRTNYVTEWQGKRKIEVVTAYVRPDGIPDFTLTEVELTHEEYENGVLQDLVEAQLGQAGSSPSSLFLAEYAHALVLVSLPASSVPCE